MIPLSTTKKKKLERRTKQEQFIEMTEYSKSEMKEKKLK